jgi:hypothetical protein
LLLPPPPPTHTHTFLRHTLRKGDGSSKVSVLLAFPDEEGGSGQGQEGMVVWADNAAHDAIKMTLPSSKVRGCVKVEYAGGGQGQEGMVVWGDNRKP